MTTTPCSTHPSSLGDYGDQEYVLLSTLQTQLKHKVINSEIISYQDVVREHYDPE